MRSHTQLAIIISLLGLHASATTVPQISDYTSKYGTYINLFFTFQNYFLSYKDKGSVKSGFTASQVSTSVTGNSIVASGAVYTNPFTSSKVWTADPDLTSGISYYAPFAVGAAYITTANTPYVIASGTSTELGSGMTSCSKINGGPMGYLLLVN
jgi:hypothetical protein